MHPLSFRSNTLNNDVEKLFIALDDDFHAAADQFVKPRITLYQCMRATDCCRVFVCISTLDLGYLQKVNDELHQEAQEGRHRVPGGQGGAQPPS